MYKSVVNISKLGPKFGSLTTDEYQPLSNISCRVSHCNNLLKLIYKEPNLKGYLGGKLGLEELSGFEKLVEEANGLGILFFQNNIEAIVKLYHKLRNIALQYVITKLRNVYIKMKPMFQSIQA